MTLAERIPTPTFPDLVRSWRKARKFSQSDLADAADISQRHLSFLESGRSRPSREMVVKLAEALEVPLRERNHLLQAAGFAAVYSHASIDEQALAWAREALAMMLTHHEPYPAVVIDRNWNLILANDAFYRVFNLFTDPGALAEHLGERAGNIMHATLSPHGLRPWITNWQDFAAWFRHQLQEELARNPFNAEARELLDELNGMPGMPEPTETERDMPPLLTVELRKDDIELNLFTMITTFGTPLDVTLQELRIESFFPANEASEAHLKAMANR